MIKATAGDRIMNKYKHFARLLVIASTILAASSASSFAQDASVVAERLKAMAAEQGMDMTWSSVSGDASEMVLEGVTIKPLGETDALPVGKLTLSGVADLNGGYSIDRLTTSPFSRSDGDVAVSLSPFVMSGIRIPATDATDAMSAMMGSYEHAELASMSVTIKGSPAFEMRGLGFSMTAPDGGKPMEFTGAAESFNVDLALVEDPKTKDIINALGYDALEGSFKMAGTWQPSDGRWSLSQYDISFDDAGTIGTTLDFGGFTPEVVKSIRELSAKMAEAGDGADNTAGQMAMLGLMQQVKFNSVSLRFDDASLTNKVIGLVAQMQGQKPADIVNLAKATVPFGMMALNNPDATAQVSNAVNTYLDNPKSIEIAAEPPAPVPFAMIMATAMSNPNDVATTANALWKMLGLTVRANQ